MFCNKLYIIAKPQAKEAYIFFLPHTPHDLIIPEERTRGKLFLRLYRANRSSGREKLFP